MATTTNYGWVTPDDTALVKDGASAIRTLGTSIDTTTFNNASAAIAKTIVDAKGDIIAATAADTVSRLAVGANDTVLTADSTAATGLKWASASAGGMTLLATTTLSGTSTVVSGINQTYNSLYIVGIGITYSATAVFKINPNSAGAWFRGSGTTQAGSVVNYVNIFPYTDGTSASNSSNSFALTFSNYTSANMKPASFYGVHATTPRSSFIGGCWEKLEAITSIQYTTEAGTATLGGTVLLYGVK